MKSLFQCRIAWRLMLAGTILFVIAAILASETQFNINIGRYRVITRQQNPLIYWGIEAGIVIVAAFLCLCAFWRNPKT